MLRPTLFPTAMLLAGSALAQSTLITFEALPGPDGLLGTADDQPLIVPASFAIQTEQLTTEFATLGIIFEPDQPPVDNRNEVLDARAVTQNILFTAPNALASAGFDPIAFRFTISVNEVSALIGLGSGTDVMIAYDAQDNVLGTVQGNAEVVTITTALPVVIARVEVLSAVIATPTIDNLTFRNNSVPIGTSYCVAAPNTTGNIGRIRASGSTTVTQGDLVLNVSSLPPQQFGIFLAARDSGQVAGSTFGSDGNLCLSGPIGRFNLPLQIQGSGLAGQFSLTVDLQQVPTPSAIVPILPGETWYFQGWYRDTSPNGSNFTDGVEIQFD